MHQGDVGPFGVVTLVLTLLLQVTCLADLMPGHWLALGTAVVTGRLALARTGLPRVAIAEGSSLGQAVAGTVSAPWFTGWLVATALLLGGVGWVVEGPGGAGRLLAAAVAGLAAAELLRLRADRRLGGVTGDVMGAMAEVATTATLLVAAALLT
jgi:adenosylcobinamide-GDP ribazoletransferase